MEYDPPSGILSPTANPPNCPGDPSFIGHLMMLPTGQIMFTDFGVGPVQIYTPAPGVDPVARPTILLPSNSLAIGSVNNIMAGRQLNGLSQNNAYGDDYQGDTNFPLVRLTNTATGNVYWALTHDESTHSIAPNTFATTKYDLPATIPAGSYVLVAITSGVTSNAVLVTVH